MSCCDTEAVPLAAIQAAGNSVAKGVNDERLSSTMKKAPVSDACCSRKQSIDFPSSICDCRLQTTDHTRHEFFELARFKDFKREWDNKRGKKGKIQGKKGKENSATHPECLFAKNKTPACPLFFFSGAPHVALITSSVPSLLVLCRYV